MWPSSDVDWLTFFGRWYFWATLGTVVFGALALFASKFMQIYSDRISESQNAAIVNAQIQIADANASAAQALETAEKERLTRVEIEESTAWRRLSQDEQTRLAHSLGRFSGQTVSLWYAQGDHESAVFAAEIALSLEAAKWNVFLPSSIVEFAPSGRRGPITKPVTNGMRVISTSDGASQRASIALVKELQALGYDAIKSTEVHRRTESVVIVHIEVRPQGPQGKAKLRRQSGTTRNY